MSSLLVLRDWHHRSRNIPAFGAENAADSPQEASPAGTKGQSLWSCILATSFFQGGISGFAPNRPTLYTPRGVPAHYSSLAGPGPRGISANLTYWGEEATFHGRWWRGSSFLFGSLPECDDSAVEGFGSTLPHDEESTPRLLCHHKLPRSRLGGQKLHFCEWDVRTAEWRPIDVKATFNPLYWGPLNWDPVKLTFTRNRSMARSYNRKRVGRRQLCH